MGLSVKRLFIALQILLIGGSYVQTSSVSSSEWSLYWNTYSALYCNTGFTESNHQYYYQYNSNLINSHNSQSSYTYKLSVNQFTGMRYIHFADLFSVTVNPMQSYATTPPSVSATPPVSYSIVDTVTTTIENQGITLGLGWAYCAAKNIELVYTYQSTSMTGVSLSAQNLVDCCGLSSPVPQTAFDYLSQYMQNLYFEEDYPSDNTLATPGMCAPPVSSATNVTQLTKYSVIADGRDDLLMQYVAAGYPVIVEYNPASFKFMSYSSGIFQQPNDVGSGSHYLVVVGYGTDATLGLDYWLCMNSFGSNWGENGYIRIIRSSTKTITKNAIFATEFLRTPRCSTTG